MKTRREFLSITVGSLFLADMTMLLGADEKDVKKTWKVGICDWDLRAAGRLSSFAVAKELGFDGVQVSYDPEGSESLANRAYRPMFLAAAKGSGVAIASLCIGLLNERPLATTREAEGWVEDSLGAIDEMNVSQVMLPFFGNGDMESNKDHQPMVIEKIKRLAPIAEKRKKIIAIESYLSAEALLKMIETIGSDVIKVYYDTLNHKHKGYDIYREIELLGSKKLISEIHFKEEEARIGGGEIDFARVCAVLEKVGYEGWIVVEGSTTGDWKESHAANSQFIKKLIGR